VSVFAELSPPYSTIVADPPWRYPAAGALTGKRRPDAHAAAQYQTMSAAEVAEMPVVRLAADNAHCYLWCSATRLFDAPHPAEILEAWGFRFVVLLTWVKAGPLGLGQHFRIDTEHVAFGVRGSVTVPPAMRQRNVFTAHKGSHSTKPAAFGDLVEQVSPGPYVELFARAPRLGWDSWGHGYEIGATA
jgi:N6-adenosine-specific RNA methylase IME4